MKIWMSIRYLYEHKFLLLMTIFTEYISSILKCVCFYILAFLKLWLNTIESLWDDSLECHFGMAMTVLLDMHKFGHNSLFLITSIGSMHWCYWTYWVSMPCQVSSKEYTLTVKCKVIEYEESYRLEKSSVNLMLLQKY